MTNSHGSFVWYVLMTSDVEGAKDFYTKVMGWGVRDASTPGIPYFVFTAGEVPVVGLMALPKESGRMDKRPGWIGYVKVHDVDAAAGRLRQLGGDVYFAPQNILNISRFSVVADPQGATLALFAWLKPTPDQPINLRGQGRVGWHELYADDWKKAWAFYGDLFNWQKELADPSVIGTYQLFSTGGHRIGGMYSKPPTIPMPFWLYYFNVGDIDAAVRRVKANNGQVVAGPSEVPGGNWTIQCIDPQGAIFALLGTGAIGYFAAAPRPGQPRTP